jgi:Excalibur calcium-binding domain
MPRRPVVRGLTAMTVVIATGGVAASHAAVKPKSYRNCAALNKAYPHGVGRQGAKDKTASDRPVTTFKVSDTLYAYNDGKMRRTGERDLDRDNDGIACEKL